MRVTIETAIVGIVIIAVVGLVGGQLSRQVETIEDEPDEAVQEVTEVLPLVTPELVTPELVTLEPEGVPIEPGPEPEPEPKSEPEPVALIAEEVEPPLEPFELKKKKNHVMVLKQVERVTSEPTPEDIEALIDKYIAEHSVVEVPLDMLTPEERKRIGNLDPVWIVGEKYTVGFTQIKIDKSVENPDWDQIDVLMSEYREINALHSQVRSAISMAYNSPGYVRDSDGYYIRNDAGDDRQQRAMIMYSKTEFGRTQRYGSEYKALTRKLTNLGVRGLGLNGGVNPGLSYDTLIGLGVPVSQLRIKED